MTKQVWEDDLREAVREATREAIWYGPIGMDPEFEEFFFKLAEETTVATVKECGLLAGQEMNNNE